MTEEFRYEEVEPEAAYAANRANWDDRVPLHLEHYGLAAFENPAHLSTVVAQDAPVLERFSGPLTGQRLVHLQCHIGTDSVSLARRGASVVGVDFSAPAVAAATELAGATGADARFVQASVYDAAAAVGGQVDVVYTSIGTIGWLDDLDAWAHEIHALLRPGGVFYFRDSHPFALTFDPDRTEGLTQRFRYFRGAEAERWDDSTTYAGPGEVRHSVTYEWSHPVSETVNALIGAGLRLEFMDEGTALPWEIFTGMPRDASGDYVLEGDSAASLPLTLTLVARRPE